MHGRFDPLNSIFVLAFLDNASGSKLILLLINPFFDLIQIKNITLLFVKSKLRFVNKFPIRGKRKVGPISDHGRLFGYRRILCPVLVIESFQLQIILVPAHITGMKLRLALTLHFLKLYDLGIFFES